MNKNSLYIDKRSDSIIKFVTFLISPFLSFLYSLRSMNTKSSYLVFFLFAVFFGMAFTVAGDLGEMKYYVDGIYYRMEFDKYCGASWMNFLMDWKEYVSFKGDIKDFYFNAVAFGVSRFSDNYHVMYAVFAAVFAYFQLRCLSFFTKEKNFENCIPVLILAFIFTWNQIFNINGVRFNTAAWVFALCVFQIYLNNNKRYFLLLAITPMIHAAFFVYAAFLIIAYFLRNFPKFWKVAFIISFFVSSLSTILLNYVESFLPDVLSGFVDRYVGVESESSDFIVTSNISGFLISISTIYVGFLMLWLVLKYRNDKDDQTNRIYSAFLILATIMNFFSSVSSLGTRMILMVYPLLAFVWLRCFGLKRYQWMILLFPLVMIITLRTKLQQYLMVTDFSFWISNPFSTLSKYL